MSGKQGFTKTVKKKAQIKGLLEIGKAGEFFYRTVFINK